MSLGDDRLGIASLCPIGGEQGTLRPGLLLVLLQESIEEFWPDGGRYLLIGDAAAFTRLHARDLDGSLAMAKISTVASPRRIWLHGASSLSGCQPPVPPHWGSLMMARIVFSRDNSGLENLDQSGERA